jgi:ribose transport system substrate-binding protein
VNLSIKEKKMSKKLLAVLSILLVAAFFLAACQPAAPAATEAPAPAEPAAPAATEAPAQPAGKPVLAVALPALDNPLMLGFKDAFTKAFGEKYDVQVASADGNPNNQATQVENFTSMKPAFLFAMPAEASSLVPKLVAARDAGVKVLVAGGDPGDEKAYDSVMMMNQYLAGMYEAYMAKQWVDATYPDAKDGTIETAILESTLNTDAANRSAGMKMIVEPWLKNVKGEYVDATGKVVSEADKVANPAYSSKVKVVADTQAEMFQAGQTAMQNILTTNPNVKLVLAYAGDGGMGASQAMLDEYAKGPGVSVIDDLNKVAVFGIGMIGPEGQAVLDSANNKSLFRGTIRFGGDLIGRTMEFAQKILNGDIQKIIYDPLDIVTVVDGKLMGLPITDTENFQVPSGTLEEIKLGPPPG